jgi:hypothetical protein
MVKWYVVAHDCNPGTQESKAGGLRVQGQPALYRETVSQKDIYSQHLKEMHQMWIVVLSFSLLIMYIYVDK